MSTLLLSAGAGFVLAALYLASPLTVWVLLAAPVVGWLGGRHLPADERRLLFGMLGAAFVARLVFVGAQFLIGIPHHSDLSVGALAGDEAYYLSRALRGRDIVLGFAGSKYDYFVATDDYGRTSYLVLLTWLQVIFGPTPYGMKLLNALLFVSGVTLLFRMARAAFGPLPAFLGLGVLLFLPSLFVSSVSLLKESLYCFVASTLTVCSLWAIRATMARRWHGAAIAFVITAVSLWTLNDLRRGAFLLGVAGLALGLVLRAVAASRRRALAAVAAVAAAAFLVLAQPSWRARAVDGVEAAAKMHAGHVFTVGHAYKLLDNGFYKNPEAAVAWDLELTEVQAVRFLVRGALTFLLTPLPWEMRSLSELVFMPEHLVWYLLLALLPTGLAAGWKRDPLVTSLLVGFALPTAAALALTTGNVGTLLRLRGLVTPHLVWLSALGLCALGEQLVTRRGAWTPSLSASASGRTAT